MPLDAHLRCKRRRIGNQDLSLTEGSIVQASASCYWNNTFLCFDEIHRTFIVHSPVRTPADATSRKHAGRKPCAPQFPIHTPSVSTAMNKSRPPKHPVLSPFSLCWTPGTISSGCCKPMLVLGCIPRIIITLHWGRGLCVGSAPLFSPAGNSACAST